MATIGTSSPTPPAQDPTRGMATLPLDALRQQLGTDLDLGLASSDAQARLVAHGPNALAVRGQRQLLHIVWEQVINPLTLILIGAVLISIYLGQYNDAVVITCIVLGNTAVGAFQEWKSESIMRSLQALVVEQAAALRDGQLVQVPVTELVPGDVVIMSEGDGVPADIRLVHAESLAINEFLFTGETVPAEKDHLSTSLEATELHQVRTCAFMGSQITRGWARGVVYGTGADTLLGGISERAAAITSEPSPLQRQINLLAGAIGRATVGIAIVLLAVGYVQYGSIQQAIVFATGIAAAMVPNGLPAQITLSLASSMERLSRRRAVVRRLSAVETLGGATVIATDKTGTITKNEMTITTLFWGGREYQVTGTGFSPIGAIVQEDGEKPDEGWTAQHARHLWCGVLSSTSRLVAPSAKVSTWEIAGDPTEGAFLVLAAKAGLSLEQAETVHKRHRLYAFDSTRKRSSALNAWPGGYAVFTKGALETVLEICAWHEAAENGKQLLTDADRQDYVRHAEDLAAQGLRVIALAYKSTDASNLPQEEAERDMTLLGMVGMMDPPHPEVAGALAEVFEAGVRVVMITGDNPITARAIAQNIGMLLPDGQPPACHLGRDLHSLSDEKLLELLRPRAVIFARVSPEDKLRVVTLLRNSGEVVAVTGDGINDTLSLKKANLGVAMGRRGAQVAKESADIVLLDDNFNTLVVAVEEGRKTYANLQKAVYANLVGNIVEITCVLLGFAGLALGYKPPITALLILLVDLIGEMFPILAIMWDPLNPQAMKAPPRNPQEKMLTRPKYALLMAAGGMNGALAYSTYLVADYLLAGEPQAYEQCLSICFAAVVCCQFSFILTVRSRGSVFHRYTLNNRGLLIGFGLSLASICAIVYVPLLQRFLSTAAPPAHLWLLPLGAATMAVLLFEVFKHYRPFRELAPA